MTLYLLDANVVQEMHPRGNPQVRTWLASVNDHQLRLSAVMFLESRKGLERERLRREKAGKDASDVLAATADLEALADEFVDRIIPVDKEIGQEWDRPDGISEKHDRDTARAATVRVDGLMLVTRNIKHVVGRGVRVLNPFVKKPAIKTARPVCTGHDLQQIYISPGWRLRGAPSDDRLNEEPDLCHRSVRERRDAPARLDGAYVVAWRQGRVGILARLCTKDARRASGTLRMGRDVHSGLKDQRHGGVS